MNGDDFKKELMKKLARSGVADTWQETVAEIEEEVIDEVSVSEDDIGTASDGTKYFKSLVNKYLTEKGYPFTQDNVDLAAKLFQANGNKLTRRNIKAVTHNEMDNVPVDLLDTYLNAKIAMMLSDIRKELVNQSIMEYSVEVIRDTSVGVTDVVALKSTLEHYSKHGWKLKSAFTNEIGKNSVEVSMSVVNQGINSTIDQLILIFERPSYINDNKSDKMRKHM